MKCLILLVLEFTMLWIPQLLCVFGFCPSLKLCSI